MSIAVYKTIGEELGESQGTTTGQMFGKACLKFNNKAFAAFYQEEMVFKLGHEEVMLLLEKYPGSQKWDPSGKKRPMKDWLQVPFEFKEDWSQLASQALDYLKSSL